MHPAAGTTSTGKLWNSAYLLVPILLPSGPLNWKNGAGAEETAEIEEALANYLAAAQSSGCGRNRAQSRKSISGTKRELFADDLAHTSFGILQVWRFWSEKKRRKTKTHRAATQATQLIRRALQSCSSHYLFETLHKPAYRKAFERMWKAVVLAA